MIFRPGAANWQELIELFYENAGNHLSRIRKAVDQGDVASLEEEVRALKGAGANTGANGPTGW